MAIGAPVRRTEDGRLVTGRGAFLADCQIPGAAFLHFVRSPYASARIVSIDPSGARVWPGVVGVYTADDLPMVEDLNAYPVLPNVVRTPHPALAGEVVRFVGEPVVAVLAETAAVARDIADLVAVDYAPLQPVPSIEQAIAPGAPLIHQTAPNNIAASGRWEGGDVAAAFAAAEHRVELVIRNSRVAPLALEPRGGVARYDPSTDEYTFWSSTQVPHRLRTELAGALRVSEGALRVVVPDVGGGFGAKSCAYQEDVVLLLVARLCGRPVKWVSTRTEDLQTSMHSRDSLIEAEAAFSHDGRLEGLRARTTYDIGAYVQPVGLVPPSRAAVLVQGAYAVRNVASELRCVFTNTAPTGPYRGAGRPEASFVIERLMDLAARDLDIEPAEIRRRNFVQPSAFPYRTPTGQVYDSGNYAGTLDRLLELADYERLRTEQVARRSSGELWGLGLATFIEPSGSMVWEGAQVRVERSGDITVLTGAGTHGQGHATTFAQIVADRLGVPLERVRVRHGDTAVTPPGVGSFGSRTTALAGSAILQAAEAVNAKARRIAAHLLECAEQDVARLGDGFVVAGALDRSVTLEEVVATAYLGINLPAGEEPGLEAMALYRQMGEMFGFGAYLAVVRIDRETGRVHLVRLVGVDDSGVLINPLLAEGQVQGGIAQGVGQALLEQVVYDETGQLVTSSLLDYAAPFAGSIPSLQLDHTVTPTPLNPLGAKGVGEAGAVGAPPAIVNAVVDALAGHGIRHVDMPVTGQKVWALLQAPPAHASPRSSAT